MYFQRRNRILLITFIAMFLFVAGCSSTNNDSHPTSEVNTEQLEKQLIEMNTHAKSMYDHMKNGDILEARAELLIIDDQLRTVAFHDVISEAGYEALQMTIFDAKATFNQVRFSMEQGLVDATKIRLLFDALTHHHQPMWIEYYKVLRKDTQQLSESIEKGTIQQISQRLEQLKYHYSVIRPAALIQRNAADIVRIDSLFTFMDSALESKNASHLGQGAEEFESLWLDLFHKKDKPTYLPLVDHRQPIYWTIGIGSVILTVLAFVAWKKFQYRQSYVSVRNEDVDEWHL